MIGTRRVIKSTDGRIALVVCLIRTYLTDICAEEVISDFRR